MMAIMSVDPVVYSYYQRNIPQPIISGQKAVFGKFGIPLEQQQRDGISHGGWMDSIFSNCPDEIIVISDIDAFPLSRDAYLRACAAAANGAVVGLAQVANHIDPSRVYAGPMFLAVRRSVYENLGRPGMQAGPGHDVGQLLTDRAIAEGVPVHLFWPHAAIEPKWALAGRGVFGIGTFYREMDFFHLFQSRLKKSVELFSQVSRNTILGRHDFAAYIKIVARRGPLSIFSGS